MFKMLSLDQIFEKFIWSLGMRFPSHSMISRNGEIVVVPYFWYGYNLGPWWSLCSIHSYSLYINLQQVHLLMKITCPWGSRNPWGSSFQILQSSRRIRVGKGLKLLNYRNMPIKLLNTFYKIKYSWIKDIYHNCTISIHTYTRIHQIVQIRGSNRLTWN